jgi:hypothetical protein
MLLSFAPTLWCIPYIWVCIEVGAYRGRTRESTPTWDGYAGLMAYYYEGVAVLVFELGLHAPYLLAGFLYYFDAPGF